MLPEQPQGRMSSPSSLPPPQIRHSSTASLPSGSSGPSSPLTPPPPSSKSPPCGAAGWAGGGTRSVGSSAAALTKGASRSLAKAAVRKARRALAMARYFALVGRGRPCSTVPSGEATAAARHRSSSSSACPATCSSAARARPDGNRGAGGVRGSSGGRPDRRDDLAPLPPPAPELPLPPSSARSDATASSAMPSTATRTVSCRRKSLYSSGSDMSITPGSFRAGISFMRACSCNSTTRSVNVGCQLGPGQVWSMERQTLPLA
mmetsp:Transcript_91507/g.267765  ORF Transcript_91507/g.267765 Transcript_91507/m.267765 type:complete len:262 (+) Transcript_91507:1284-2069(+)